MAIRPSQGNQPKTPPNHQPTINQLYMVNFKVRLYLPEWGKNIFESQFFFTNFFSKQTYFGLKNF